MFLLTYIMSGIDYKGQHYEVEVQALVINPEVGEDLLAKWNALMPERYLYTSKSCEAINKQQEAELSKTLVSWYSTTHFDFKSSRAVAHALGVL